MPFFPGLSSARVFPMEIGKVSISCFSVSEHYGHEKEVMFDLC